jgi:hypothetical protein
VALVQGAEHLKGRAAATTARLLAAIAKRDQQAAIFGSRTRSQVKRDEARVQRSGQVTHAGALARICSPRSQLPSAAVWPSN